MRRVLDIITEQRVIAIARCVPRQEIENLARAIGEGGLSCIEVTFDHSGDEGIKNTLESIRALKTRFGDSMAIGAGTVLSEDEVDMAADAGAEYIISPDTVPEVIKRTRSLNLISIPGAMTPSEIHRAYDLGANLVKLFPASCLGTAYIKAVRGPLPHIPLLATGGINPENIGQYLAAGALGAGVGGNLVSLKLIQQGRFDEITRTAEAYARAVAEALRAQ
ncbi:MAG: bifunctional 4-hydroxy-2-oxoglutarate aldolase/2-dehydro-3-deoxy-phosphogluconate aldolase [Clostridia bacterium]|nr:bifunctional 4-hydroxy-2-oxoglutarate aldolase/2-dehydro-3-deoxy-phosphogluconate aldolase [Clostridia bacterium]